MKIHKEEKTSTDNLVLGVYGAPGSGKTYQGGLFPVGETLFIDIDRGLETISGSGHHSVKPETIIELEDILRELRRDKIYRYIIVDSISEMEYKVQKGRKGERERAFMNQQLYGESGQVMNDLLRGFKELKSLGKTVMFLAHETMEKVSSPNAKKDDFTKSGPAVAGKLMKSFLGMCDAVGRLSVDSRTQQRVLQFDSSERVEAKSRVREIGGVIHRPNLWNIVKAYELDRNKDKAELDELITEIKKEVLLIANNDTSKCKDTLQTLTKGTLNMRSTTEIKEISEARYILKLVQDFKVAAEKKLQVENTEKEPERTPGKAEGEEKPPLSQSKEGELSDGAEARRNITAALTEMSLSKGCTTISLIIEHTGTDNLDNLSDEDAVRIWLKDVIPVYQEFLKA